MPTPMLQEINMVKPIADRTFVSVNSSSRTRYMPAPSNRNSVMTTVIALAMAKVPISSGVNSLAMIMVDARPIIIRPYRVTNEKTTALRTSDTDSLSLCDGTINFQVVVHHRTDREGLFES